MKKVGICFSKELKGDTPLSHIGAKLPVYTRLLDFIKNEGWQPFILTRKTYQGGGIFKGGWLYRNGQFVLTNKSINIDLVYDRSGGIDFPPEESGLKVVNPRNFKILCWDKYATYKEIGKYMPATYLLTNEKDIKKYLPSINTDRVVLKPFNGLKGLGIYIGSENGAKRFKFSEKYPKYIMQEFVDTSGGISGITNGMHDLRIAIINGKPLWCHIRIPKKGKLLANAAQGGKLIEIDYKTIPTSIKIIVGKVTKKFLKKYGNTIYSLDFGVDKNGIPYIFEINDQIGFPKYEMKNRDIFLSGLISLFRKRLKY